MNPKPDTDSVKGKILVVDDEEIICYSLRLVLEKRGYEVVTAQRAQEALDKLKEETFDVVLADIRMPEMDGIQMLKAIRQIDPQLPVIFITGYPAIQTAAEGLKWGAEDYITKPFDNVQKVLVPIEKAMVKRKEDKLIVESQAEKIECMDCYHSFFSEHWQPDIPCPKCNSSKTFPVPTSPVMGGDNQKETESLDAWRFGRIARWADLISSSQLVECLTIQRERKKTGELVPLLGDLMVEKGYLTRREVRSILKVQSIRRVTQEENKFGKIAVVNYFITEVQLKECIDIQSKMILYQEKAPLLGEILLEKGYITERQIKTILKFQMKEKNKGLLKYLQIKRLDPVRRFGRRLVVLYHQLGTYGLILVFVAILLLVCSNLMIDRRYLFHPRIEVINNSGKVYKVAPGELPVVSKKSEAKLFYALYCEKCRVYFPLKINSESGKGFKLQPCPKCRKLEHVDIPESVRKVIAREKKYEKGKNQ